MAFRLPIPLILIWLCFLIRGAFYSTMMPLWEGFDEYAHFARFSQSAVPLSSAPMPREIEETFHLVPLPDQLAWMGPYVRLYPQWWALPEAERALRLAQLRAIPANHAWQPSVEHFHSYEAQQPPLYYWILSAPLHFARNWNIADRVLFLRLLSIGIASLAIPLTYLAGRNLFGQSTFGENTGLVAAALLAVSPMFAIDTARVANDCLAIALTALLLVLASTPRTRWWHLGLILGCALIAKAFLLALIPAVVILWRKRPAQLAGVLALAAAMAGWWYVRNLLLLGRLTGWEDDAPFRLLLANVFRVDWPRAAGAVSKSALWFGGWSFLTVKAWMYHVLLLVIGGSALLALRQRKHLIAPCLILFWFLAAMAYDVTAEFTTQHTSSAPGWYLWAVGSCAAVVIAAGAQRAGPALVLLLAAFDIYSANFVLLPYYSGLAAHGRSFAHASQVLEAIHRLPVPTALWIASAFATFLIPALCLPRFAQENQLLIPSNRNATVW